MVSGTRCLAWSISAEVVECEQFSGPYIKELIKDLRGPISDLWGMILVLWGRMSERTELLKMAGFSSERPDFWPNGVLPVSDLARVLSRIFSRLRSALPNLLPLPVYLIFLFISPQSPLHSNLFSLNTQGKEGQVIWQLVIWEKPCDAGESLMTQLDLQNKVNTYKSRAFTLETFSFFTFDTI